MEVNVSEDLRRALRDPGYTPPRRAFDEVFALLSHPELGEKAERALLSAGLSAATYAAENIASSGDETAPALVRLIGRAARAHDEPALLTALGQALHSASPETQRQAAMALGKTGRPEAAALLLPCLDSQDPKLLRSTIEALGKVGGEQALPRLRNLKVPSSLTQVLERACLMLERSVGRSVATADPIALDRALPSSAKLVLECRAGLARFLEQEAAALGATLIAPDEVALDYAGPLRRLLELRLASSVALSWPLTPNANADSILNALLEPELVALLTSWSNGPIRFRLEWRGAGHRRADTWKVAQGLREAGSPLLNDPVQAPWTIEVQATESPRLLLKPAGAPELRFDYRARDVQGASHPTIAAALARVAAPQAGDVVWDPFAGSGVELIECARLAAVAKLHGTDLDPRALQAARENTAKAGVQNVELEQGDARQYRVPGLTLVVTNPPMGRRVLRARGLSGVLCQLVRHVAGQLGPGGRMVWLSPFAEATARAASDAGLKVERLGPVDLGGFDAELQRFAR